MPVPTRSVSKFIAECDAKRAGIEFNATPPHWFTATLDDYRAVYAELKAERDRYRSALERIRTRNDATGVIYAIARDALEG